MHLSLTRYEVACCDGNISLHQRRIAPVRENTVALNAFETKKALHHFQELLSGNPTFCYHPELIFWYATFWASLKYMRF